MVPVTTNQIIGMEESLEKLRKVEKIMDKLWMEDLHQLIDIRWSTSHYLPSGKHTNIAIENGHRNTVVDLPILKMVDLSIASR